MFGATQTIMLDKSAHVGNTPGIYLLTITDGIAIATEKVLIE
ncbi:MAG: hypothetical protein SH857_00055 [Chitinophagales bacterium]|nr:hypothetical protein [Chitinophagales bacterium]